jgi:FkbM family methyltransferase
MKLSPVNSLLGEVLAMAWHNRNARLGELNHDPDRFGPYRAGSRPTQPIKRLRRFLKKLFHMAKCERLYRSLEDDASRRCLVEVMAYRLVGPEKIRLSTNNPTYWEARAKAVEMASATDVQTAQAGRWQLPKYELASAGYPVSLYATSLGVATTFIQRHYAYDARVAPDKGDCVLDAGGCWGDTALFFADAVGKSGHVYSFEFIPSNVAILKRNIAMNPDLQAQVTVVEAPLWGRSGQVFFCTDEGPSSRLSTKRDSDQQVETTTITIDDFVTQNGLQHLDFIKMDIEGAELPALRGAEVALRRFKPKLAISLYHSLSDFWQIPEYLQSLNCGYKFYLGHYTIHMEETVLFAIAGD